jgi:hypothetical protein
MMSRGIPRASVVNHAKAHLAALSEEARSEAALGAEEGHAWGEHNSAVRESIIAVMMAADEAQTWRGLGQTFYSAFLLAALGEEA